MTQSIGRAITGSFLLLFCFGLLQAQEIKVLTYNIYHGEKNYERGKSNIEAIAAVINEYKPDFVAMQEVDSMTVRTASFNNGVRKDLVQELAKLTGMYGYFGKAMDYDNGGYGEGILSRFPDKPNVYQLPIPKGGEERALITIQHTFPNGQKIVFGGTHLCHEFEENRIAQAKQVASIATTKGIPAIILGDFNITPDSKPYKAITAKMNDAAVLYGNPQLTFPYHKPKYRLDYIFLNKNSKWKVKDVKVIKNNASDHMPVLVTLSLE
ncbi:endonuclease/exonuclease/phosphatase family protein [Elizabethkingia anophelis]|uniref:endonuclease/exonuclease/phosphatase family protein n=1 Tax=Elizabethkingia anophelis TaxID=1117645 RepID=UPI000C9BF34D|nr:endonuclease/exonuclease/phosphatase family protein [Elizabethkingia anophelis]MCT3760160.1 endonuclease/exonuclease/phosphatase family protein [Elizabethkingia anophelis]MCT3974808.1 endonuclease/exonuclease/phosphatase family protein [Elizabethkingia anophelis]MCT4003146.1 endonuclease/exonuclease/phosphatase family protein [Elizabethkingia anophelis]MCT4017165.1 endonuclease/exonuclease/phosphatase family protein [Elizabethkingia anophelis]MCT4020727.1 endonuclease/exonuclease/phosphatas